MNAILVSSLLEGIVLQLHAAGIRFSIATLVATPATEALPNGVVATLVSQSKRSLIFAIRQPTDTLNFGTSLRNDTTSEIVYARDLLKAVDARFSYDDFKIGAGTREQDAHAAATKLVSALTASPRVVEILCGRDWLHVAFDWAGMR